MQQESESRSDSADEIRRCSTIKQSETKTVVFELLRNSAGRVLDVASTSMELLEREKKVEEVWEVKK
jgi:hypothetical protein